MSNADYEDRIDDLLNSWTEEIYSGVLVDDVLPAVQIYAHASLDGMVEEYDVPAVFPMFLDEFEICDHYGNALFARLSSACTSIRNALQSIQAHMDCHGAIAASRRAHESLWQMFWICNPTKNADERIARVLTLTKQEIKESLRYFSNWINPEVEGKLRDYRINLDHVTDKSRYSSSQGRKEYRDYFGPRFNDPLPPEIPPAPRDVDAGEIAWSMMCNMTHPNVIFDWIIQIQKDSQNGMDRLQLLPVIGAMGTATNLSTLMMQGARLADDHIVRVNVTYQHCRVFATTSDLYVLAHLAKVSTFDGGRSPHFAAKA